MPKKFLEYECALVYKRGSKVWIRQFLDTLSYPLEGDYLYIFEGRVSGIGVTFRGDFTDNELKALIHEVLSVFKSQEPRFVDFIRSKERAVNYVQSLKEGEK